MNLQEALQTAIKNEKRIRDHYARGAEAILDPAGKKAFETLAKEEQGHVDYLEGRLKEWTDTGKVTLATLGTLLPPKSWLEEMRSSLKKTSPKQVAKQQELDLLKAALELEKQTSAFYRKLVDDLHETDSALFAQFLETEEGHVAIVQAELDSLQGLGYWFDMPEFALEAQ